MEPVVASGQNVDMLVLGTEGNGNTGAQVSKATPMGATMEMAAGGKEAKKKDLGAIAMMIKNCYVASVTRVADVNQTVKAFKEAEAYKGPSIVIVYAACVDWGAGPATRPGCGSRGSGRQLLLALASVQPGQRRSAG